MPAHTFYRAPEGGTVSTSPTEVVVQWDYRFGKLLGGTVATIESDAATRAAAASWMPGPEARGFRATDVAEADGVTIVRLEDAEGYSRLSRLEAEIERGVLIPATAVDPAPATSAPDDRPTFIVWWHGDEEPAMRVRADSAEALRAQVIAANDGATDFDILPENDYHD